MCYFLIESEFHREESDPLEQELHVDHEGEHQVRLRLSEGGAQPEEVPTERSPSLQGHDVSTAAREHMRLLGMAQRDDPERSFRTRDQGIQPKAIQAHSET